jgi:hypothetical protein
MSRSSECTATRRVGSLAAVSARPTAIDTAVDAFDRPRHGAYSVVIAVELLPGRPRQGDPGIDFAFPEGVPGTLASERREPSSPTDLVSGA